MYIAGPYSDHLGLVCRKMRKLQVANRANQDTMTLVNQFVQRGDTLGLFQSLECSEHV